MSNTYLIQVFGTNLIEMEDRAKAERYASAIRAGLWQCNMTDEPWKMGQRFDNQLGDDEPAHICSYECLDSRTDDDISVQEVANGENIRGIDAFGIPLKF